MAIKFDRFLLCIITFFLKMYFRIFHILSIRCFLKEICGKLGIRIKFYKKITEYNYLFSILKGVLVKTDKVFSFNPSGMRSLQNGKSIEVKEVVHKNMIDTRHSQSVSLSY